MLQNTIQIHPLFYNEDGKKEYVEVKKYRCKNCGKGSQVEFKGEFKKYSGLPIIVDEQIIKLNSLHVISLRDKVKIFKNLKNIDISHEYIRKVQLITNELFWVSEDIKYTNYANYDVQWIPTDVGWEYFHVLTDFKTKKIVAVELTKDEEIKTTREFFKKSLKFNPKVIITDLKPGYHKLIQNELKSNHQQCIIHFRKDLNKKIKAEIGKIKSTIKGLLLIENPDINDETLKKEIKNRMKPISNKYWYYKDDIMETFNKESYDESVAYINELKIKAEKYPESIRNYLHNVFFKNYRSFILYKYIDFKGKIPSNNNLSETKIGWCASKSEKKKYRTGLGFFNHVISRIKFWG